MPLRRLAGQNFELVSCRAAFTRIPYLIVGCPVMSRSGNQIRDKPCSAGKEHSGRTVNRCRRRSPHFRLPGWSCWLHPSTVFECISSPITDHCTMCTSPSVHHIPSACLIMREDCVAVGQINWSWSRRDLITSCLQQHPVVRSYLFHLALLAL